jgi:diguanylate cyclase (GGDEF)-like protein
MSRQQEYRKPRNKELHELAWSLPYPIRITNPKGKILWQNQAAENSDSETEWSQSPTTWQNKKAFLERPTQAVDSESAKRVEELEEAVDRLKRQQRDTARKKRQAESRLKTGENELESALKNAARLEEKLNSLDTEVQSLREENSRLKEEVGAREAKSSEQPPAELLAELDELRARVSELDELESARARISELEENLAEAQDRDDDKPDEVKELQTRLARLEEDKQAAETWLEELEQNRDQIDLQLQSTQKELAAVREEFAAYRSRAEEADADRELAAQLAEKVAEFELLEDAFEEEQKVFERQKAELQERLTSQESELESLKVGFESRSGEQAVVSTDELEGLRSRLEESESTRRSSEKELGRLRDRLDALEELKSERESLLASIQEDLKESLNREKELRETIKLYSEVRDEAEKARTEAGTLKRQVAELEGAQQKLRQELLTAREKLVNSGGGGSSGEGLSLSVKSQIDFLTKRLSDTEKKLDQTVAQLKAEQSKNQSSKESERLAFQDSLTGLPNQNMIRRYLDYARQQASTSGRAIGLFLIDLDDFRMLNEAYGRDWGDALLKAVGERLNGMRGGSHMVARHSQDRFMLLAADLERGQLNSFVDQASRSLLDALAYPFDVRGEQVKVTGSVGIGIGPVQGDNPELLYLQAEQALKEAKRSGPGRYSLFDDRMAHSLKTENTYKSQMAHAIEKSEFKAAYQPVYDLVQKRILGLELLTRWERRDQTVLRPAEFLEPAIRSGLILKITEHLWPRAFALFARWQRMRKGLTLSINLCDKELLSPGLLQRTVNMVNQAGVNPSSVFFEVRDQSAVRRSPQWWEILQAYSQAGFGLCLDDYGSEASLFGTLGFHGFRQAKLLVDERTLLFTPSHQARKDLQYCAKGVAQKFDKKALAKAGFHLAQGYAISRPLDEADVDGLLS